MRFTRENDSLTYDSKGKCVDSEPYVKVYYRKTHLKMGIC